MDEFTLLFMAVGFGLFWISYRDQRPAAGPVYVGWILLAGSLGASLFLLGETPGSVLTCHVIRTLMLAGVVACVGLRFAYPVPAGRPAPSPAGIKADELEMMDPADA
jgi:hypothetical protein